MNIGKMDLNPLNQGQMEETEEEIEFEDSPFEKASRSTASLFKKPLLGKKTDPELDVLDMNYLRGPNTFGVPLKSLELRTENVGSVPSVVRHCIDYFKAYGYAHRGLFQGMEDTSLGPEVDSLRAKYDQSQPSRMEASTNPRVVSLLLLRFLDGVPVYGSV